MITPRTEVVACTTQLQKVSGSRQSGTLRISRIKLMLSREMLANPPTAMGLMIQNRPNPPITRFSRGLWLIQSAGRVPSCGTGSKNKKAASQNRIDELTLTCCKLILICFIT